MMDEATQKANNDGNGKVFRLSRHRVVFYTLVVFVLSLFVAFWADNLMVGGIWDMTAAEIIAMFCLALGISMIFLFVFKLTEVKPLIVISEHGITLKRNKKVLFIGFSDVVSVRGHEGVLTRLVKTQKVIIETHAASYGIYLAAEDVKDFFAHLPVLKEKRKITGEISFHKERYWLLLSGFVQTSLFFLLVFTATFPAVAVLLDGFSESRFYLFALLALYAAALLVGLIHSLVLFVRYAGSAVRFKEDRLSISYGKKMSYTEHDLFFDSILAFRIKESIIEKMFGICRLSAESKQKSKGVSDYNYFPFPMKRACAEQIIETVFPDHDFDAEKTRSGFRGIVPYFEYIAWFAAAVIIMSVFLTPLMLLLLLFPFVAVWLAYAREGYSLGELSASFDYGFLCRNTLIVRYDDMESVTASDNFVSVRLGLTALDITVGQYTRVFSVGYVNRTDFFELAEKLEKKVDKDK